MYAYVRIYDEFFPCQSHAVIWRKAKLKSLVWVAHIHHNLCLWPFQLPQVSLFYLKLQFSLVDIALLSLSAAYSDVLPGFYFFSSLSGADNARDSQLARDYGGVAIIHKNWAIVFCENNIIMVVLDSYVVYVILPDFP